MMHEWISSSYLSTPPYWRRPYSEIDLTRQVEALISKFDKIDKSQDMIQVMQDKYIDSIVITECLTNDLEINNVKRAYQLMQQQQQNELTINTTLQLHRVLMNGILNNAGTYRTINVKPYGSIDFEYIDSSLISKRMNRLFKEMNHEIQYTYDLLTSVKLVAYFISEFLLIHPFRDGNGRVVTLMSSILLNSLCNSLPIYLCCSSIDRRHYIHCLEDRNYTSKPDMLVHFLLESVSKSVSYALYLEDEE